MSNNSRLSFKYRGTTCLNCNHPLDISDKYCPNCSQLNSTKKLKLADLFNEFFASIISYDSKFRQTLNALVFKPGAISKEFVAGKRMTYTNPFRFYISVSIIFFLLQGFIIKLESFSSIKNYNTTGKQPDIILTIKKTLDSIRPEKNLDSVLKNIRTERELSTMSFSNRTGTKIKDYSEYYETKNQNNIDSAFIELKHTPTIWNRFIYKKVADGHYFSNNIDKLIDYIRSVLPAIAFFFLPVFTFLIWLIYSKRKYNYMDHLVFTFHTQTMFFFILILNTFIGLFFDTIFVTVLLIGLFGFYLYKALRKFYGQSRVITIIKFVFLNILLTLLLTFGTIFAFLGSFLLY